MSDLAVIVPVLDEAANLPALLDALGEQTGIALEIIVADGGSADASRAVAEARGATVVRSEPGRGAQMNAGAAAATAPWLLFLHADCRFEHPEQLARATAAMAGHADERAAGHFALRFARSRPGHRFLYRYMEAKSTTGRPYTINGDQGLLIARDWFRALGGFDASLPFLEDQRMAQRVDAEGRWVLLPGRLVTSARRFEAEGPRRRYLLMAIIMAMHAVDMREFFERAPNVYRTQADAGTLLITPCFRLLRRLMRELGARESARRWYAVGGFVLGQSWQPFFAFDVLLQPLIGRRRPTTFLHDRLIAPLIRHRVGQALATALAFVVSMGILAPWCRWRERRALRYECTAPSRRCR